MEVVVKIDEAAVGLLEKYNSQALKMTADAVLSDLRQSQTMPFKEGVLQNDQSFVDDENAESGEEYVVSDTPYARRLYFHPEYHFNFEHNPNAGGSWFEPYISGNKSDFVKNAYARFLKGKIGGG